MTKFKALTIENWRQFGSVNIEFHDQATIIVGVNGSGKTSILTILSQHFGWPQNFVSTRDEIAHPRHQEIGSITYQTGVETSLADLMWTPPKRPNSTLINTHIHRKKNVPGIYIPSHRPVYSYQTVKQIPTEVQLGQQLFDPYLSEQIQFHQPETRTVPPNVRLKEALISLATFGPGNNNVDRNDEAVETFEGFKEILGNLLPPELGFKEVRIRIPEVIVRAEAGNFALDAASGGLAALFDIAWQIYMRSRTDKAAFTVLIDEPENHLHPSLQRSILPSLIKAFPQAQFIVATHNPFVVTSVKESNVILLDFAENGVEAKQLDFDRSATANKVLTDVLGIPYPAPLWVEIEIENIVESLQDKELNKEQLANLRDRLDSVGLSYLFPEVIDRLLPVGNSAKGQPS